MAERRAKCEADAGVQSLVEEVQPDERIRDIEIENEAASHAGAQPDQLRRRQQVGRWRRRRLGVDRHEVDSLGIRSIEHSLLLHGCRCLFVLLPFIYYDFHREHVDAVFLFSPVSIVPFIDRYSIDCAPLLFLQCTSSLFQIIILTRCCCCC